MELGVREATSLQRSSSLPMVLSRRKTGQWTWAAAATLRERRTNCAERKPVAISGTWQEGEDGSQNQITLATDSESACGGRLIDADLRSEDGVLHTFTLLGEHVDLATAENWFILYLDEPETTPDSCRCLNYN